MRIDTNSISLKELYENTSDIPPVDMEVDIIKYLNFLYLYTTTRDTDIILLLLSNCLQTNLIMFEYKIPKINVKP